MQDYQIQDFQNYLQTMGLNFASSCFHNDMPSDRTATALISHEALEQWCNRFFGFQYKAKMHMDAFTDIYLPRQYRIQEAQWQDWEEA